MPLEPADRDEAPISEPVSPGEGPEEITLRTERRQNLRQSIQALSPDYREVVLLHHFHHLSYQQIADRLEIPVRTVETRLYRARAQLKKLVLAMEGGDSGGVQGGSAVPGRLLESGARG